MSTVMPNGQIRLLSGVPIDDTYENTLYFESQAQQTAYFLGLTPVHQMVGATRVRDGVIKVDVLCDNILTADYMMFQNKNFSDKWFYAFIEDVRYINNGTSEIQFSIDEIQTWLFDPSTSLEQCYIERQHSVTDEIGDNIIGENMGGNELVISRTLGSENFCTGAHEKLVIFNSSTYFGAVEDSNEDEDAPTTEPKTAPIGITVGIANGTLCNGWSYSNNSGTDKNIVSGLTDYINNLVKNNQNESMVGGYVLPYKLFDDYKSTAYITTSGSSGEDEEIHYSGDGAPSDKVFPFNTSSAYTSLDGYVPKNKKMFTAPFNWIYALSTDGQFIPLQPQFMGNKNALSFKAYHCITGVPEARLVLQNYKGEPLSYENYISFGSFPQLSFAVDGYKAWVASGGEASLQLSLDQTQQAQQLVKQQAGWEVATGVARGIISGIGHTAQIDSASKSDKANAGQQKLSGALGLANDFIDMSDAVVKGYYTFKTSEQTIQFANENADLQRTIARSLPSAVHGRASNTALLGANDIGLKIEQRCVNKKVAESIDNFFTMYGYAQNVVGQPVLKARKSFTYIKTVGCKVKGGCPSSTIAKLQAIFDTGIRFWVNANDVGHYTTVDNGVLTQV